MTCWTKPELENMLEDVVNELDLSDGMLDEHGPHGTAPAKLVRLVLERKDLEIAMLKRGMVAIEPRPPEPGTKLTREQLLQQALQELLHCCATGDVIEGHRRSCGRFKGDACQCRTRAAIESGHRVLSQCEPLVLQIDRMLKQPETKGENDGT